MKRPVPIMIALFKKNTSIPLCCLTILLVCLTSNISTGQEPYAKFSNYPNEEYLKLTSVDTVGIRLHDVDPGLLYGKWKAIKTYDVGVWPTAYWPLMLGYNKTGFTINSSGVFYGGERLELIGVDYFRVSATKYLSISKNLHPPEIGLTRDSMQLARVRTILRTATDHQVDSLDFMFLLNSDTTFVYETTVFRRQADSLQREFVFQGRGNGRFLLPLEEPIYKLNAHISDLQSPTRFRLSAPNGLMLLDTVLDSSSDANVALDLLKNETYVYSIRILVNPVDNESSAWTIRLCTDCGPRPTRYKYQKYW